MSKERICRACLKSYRYCPNCGEYAKFPRWMNDFDTDVCHEIFNVISGYNMGIMTKENVKNIVDKYEIKDFSIFKESIANKLKELFPVEEVKSESVVKTVDESPIEEVVEDVKFEPSYSYKRNNRKRNRNVDIDLSENE